MSLFHQTAYIRLSNESEDIPTPDTEEFSIDSQISSPNPESQTQNIATDNKINTDDFSNKDRQIDTSPQSAVNDTANTVISSVPLQKTAGLTPELPDSSAAIERVEELTQLADISKEMPQEIHDLLAVLNEVQNLAMESEKVTADQVTVEIVRNSTDSQFVNRVICRPRLGKK
ncbi:MAG: hypothetical protein LBQ54_05395 [Planctomycetaceae bacterium]|nr:hypothetical protein [Planctomycetaceae bacterium]